MKSMRGFNQLKNLIKIGSFLLCLSSQLGFAQELSDSRYRYYGFEAHFGVKSTKLSSDLAAIHNMDVIQEGGSVGFVLGSRAVKTRLQAAGFYYSHAGVKHAVNAIESGLTVNVYPLKFINTSNQALNPYLSGGVDYNIMKFFGYYATPDSKVNYSRSSAAYIGKVAYARGSVGGGIEWRLPQEYDFVHLFAEARYSWAIDRNADEILKHTTAANTASVNLGVSFGFLR